MAKKINLIDVTLRDAHQCLWATRMTTGMMRETAPLLDRAGFEAIDLVGGAVFDVCVRFLREDPWERMRILSEWVTKTPLIIHHRGQSLFTFELFADDVVELTAERIAANGMRYHTTYDALNDIRNLEVPVRAAKNVGLTVAGGVVFTETPVHTDAYYEKKTRELLKLGVDAVFIKDPSGLLRPRTGRNTRAGAQESLRQNPPAAAFALFIGTRAVCRRTSYRARRRLCPHRDLDAGQCSIPPTDGTLRP